MQVRHLMTRDCVAVCAHSRRSMPCCVYFPGGVQKWDEEGRREERENWRRVKENRVDLRGIGSTRRN